MYSSSLYNNDIINSGAIFDPYNPIPSLSDPALVGIRSPVPHYPVFIKKLKPNYTFWIIIMTIIVIFTIVAAIIAYGIFRNRDTILIRRCEPGLCTVNTISGAKRCPNDLTTRLIYTPGLESCTSKNYCQSQLNPCAVLPGGILDCDGVCGPGNDECNCQKAPA